MTPFLLWFNLLAFVLLFAGFGFELLGWVRQRERWRALYVWYIAIYAIWLFVQTFTYFAVSYLEQPIAWLSTVVMYLWVAASVGLILVVAHLIAQVSGFQPGKLGTALLYLPAAATLAALVLALRNPTPIAFETINLAFNGVICGLMTTGTIRVWKRKSCVPRHEVLPFLLLSSLLYVFLLSLGVMLVVRPASPGNSVVANGATGAFCLSWAILLVVTGFRRASAAARTAAGLPPRFLDDFAISPREADIIGLLVLGAANRQISEKLFISPRTVEAHIYSIYRKCDCRNRVELMNRIQLYRPAQ
jgi:DNA-binding CsgD family transcriptional regulator